MSGGLGKAGEANSRTAATTAQDRGRCVRIMRGLRSMNCTPKSIGPSIPIRKNETFAPVPVSLDARP